MDRILVLVGGLTSALFVLWFFFGKQNKKEVKASLGGQNLQEAKIIVDGGYNPNLVTLKKDIPASLRFLRRDPSSCLEEVVISDFKIRQKLVLGEETEVSFTPEKAGEFDFSCGMGMFHGKLIVVE